MEKLPCENNPYRLPILFLKEAILKCYLTDFHMKYCIVGQDLRISITGRSPQEKEVKALSENPHSETILKGKDLW
jgi:hypothetical protein